MSNIVEPYIGKLTTFLGWDGTNFRAISVDEAGQIDVTVIGSALPAGAATEATLATLATEAKLELVRLLLVSLAAEDFATETTLNLLLTELALKADLTETQPVSAAALPLPLGAATLAKQDIVIAALATPKLIEGTGLKGPLIADSRESTAIGAGATAALFDTGSGYQGQVLTVYIMFDGIADAAKWSSIEFSIDGGAYAGISMFSAGYFVQWTAKQFPWMECLTWDNAGFKYEFWFKLPFAYTDRLQARVTNGDGANASTYSYAVFYTKS